MALTRTASSSSYVPPAARKLVAPAAESPLPSSPTFFTARSSYFDSLYKLERELNKFTFQLHDAHIMPLPRAATYQLGPIPSYWRTVGDMDQLIGKGIRETQYRRLITVLSQLNRLKRIAELGGAQNVAKDIAEIIAPFERPNKEILQAQKTGRKKPVPDEHGRAYALGRRKTSSARVWVIPIQPSTYLATQDAGTVPTAQVLINGLPVSRYFTHIMDRERVFRPLKLTGTLASYNVFSLVRGGGTMAQAEAIALGISKCMQVLEPSVGSILKQGKLLRRDPRMVERKKTNLAKARKAYTWVKR